MGLRRFALHLSIAVIGVAAVSGCSSSSGNSDGSTEVFRLGNAPVTNILEGIAAGEGFLKDEGISIESIQLTTAGPQIAALVKGDTDGSILSPAIVAGHNASDPDNKLVFLTSTFVGDFNIVVPKSSKIASASEGLRGLLASIKGKTVCVPAVGGAYDLEFRKMLSDGGLNPAKDVKYVSVTDARASIATLTSGDIDACLFSTSNVAASIASGDLTTVLSAADKGKLPAELSWMNTLWTGGVAVTQKAFDKNPAKFEKYARAIQAAQGWLADSKNSADAASYVAKTLGSSVEAGQAYVSIAAPANTHTLSCDLVDQTFKTYKEIGLATASATACSEIAKIVSPN